MDNLVSEYIDSYFNILQNIGYLNYDIVDSLLAIILINDLNTPTDYE